MKRHQILLFLIFALVLAFRLWFVFQVELHPDAYFEMRQVESILESGMPLFEDPLSYGGRQNVVFPVFYYLMAFFSLFVPIILGAYIIPNFLASLLVFVVFYISRYITQNNEASLFAAFISGFIPIFIGETLNTISPLSLQIPLIFLLLYCFMRLRSDNFAIAFMVLAFVLPLVHHSTYSLILGFFIYLGFSYIEKFQFKARSYELMLFFLFISLWLMILITKDALVLHGTGVFWQNIPSSLLDNYFSEVTLPKIIGGIGIINLLVGVYVLQKYLFNNKNKNVYLLSSFCLSIIILLYFKLISLNLGLVFLAVTLAIFFSMFYDLLFDFLRKSHFQSLSKFFIFVLVVIFAFNSIIPSIAHAAQVNQLEESDIRALEWIRDSTPLNSTVLAPLRMGHAINRLGERKNVIDSQFMLVALPEQRLSDVEEFYETDSPLKKVEIVNFYEADYVFSEGSNPVLLESPCFDRVFRIRDKVEVYKAICAPRVERI